MLDERLDRIKRLQDQADVQQTDEHLIVLMDLVGRLVFEVAWQLTAQAIVAAL